MNWELALYSVLLVLMVYSLAMNFATRRSTIQPVDPNKPTLDVSGISSYITRATAVLSVCLAIVIALIVIGLIKDHQAKTRPKNAFGPADIW